MSVEHYRKVVRELTEGSVVPLLGAGVNLCGRPPELTWSHPSEYLPSGAELASYLATTFFYPTVEEPPAADAGTVSDDAAEPAEGEPAAGGASREPPRPEGEGEQNGEEAPPVDRQTPRAIPSLDLLRVSQYIASTDGAQPLYRELRKLFNANYPPTRVHDFFAAFPANMRAVGDERYQLIVTTNYDDALERAFDARSRRRSRTTSSGTSPIRSSSAGNSGIGRAGRSRARSCARTSTTTSRLDKRTLILKIHGAIDRDSPARDSFVITEDHYIDYLTKTEIEKLLPPAIITRLRESGFLFLGYSMADWNLRVILHRIWGEQELTYTSWAIRKDVDSRREGAVGSAESSGARHRARGLHDRARCRAGPPPGGAGREGTRVTETKAEPLDAPPRLPLCPYVGLIPFTAADQRFFFGRDERTSDHRREPDGVATVDRLRTERRREELAPARGHRARSPEGGEGGGAGRSPAEIDRGRLRILARRSAGALRRDPGRRRSGRARRLHARPALPEPQPQRAPVVVDAPTRRAGSSRRGEHRRPPAAACQATRRPRPVRGVLPLSPRRGRRRDVFRRVRRPRSTAATSPRTSSSRFATTRYTRLDRFEDEIPNLFTNNIRIEHLGRHAAEEAIRGPIRTYSEESPSSRSPLGSSPSSSTPSSSR